PPTLNGTHQLSLLNALPNFQYGTTTSYGSVTPNLTYNGTTTQNVSSNISGLAASTTYHFHIVAMNSAGTVHGADRTFTTLSPTRSPDHISNPPTCGRSSSAT